MPGEPELRIKGVVDLSQVRQDLATLQGQAARGINVSGTFAGESARGATSLTAPAPASSIATGIFQSPPPAAAAIGTPAESVGATMLNSSDLAGGGGRAGGPLGLPIGAKGLTYAGLIHAGSQVIQNEEAYQRRLAAAGGSLTGIAEAELKHRTDYDHLFFGVGRIGRAIRDLDPSGVSSGQVEGIISSTTAQEKRIESQERSLGFFRGLQRDVDTATAAPGLARHLASIDAQTGGRRDHLAAEIRTERDRESERYRGALAENERQRSSAGRGHAFGISDSDAAHFDAQRDFLGREHAALSGPISRREREGLEQINSIDAAERAHAKADSAARGVGIDAETGYLTRLAGGLLGRAARLEAVRTGAFTEVEQARLRGDEHLEGITAQAGARVSAASVDFMRDRQQEQFRLQADTQVMKLRTGGHTATAHLLAASAAGGLAVANADPDDQAAAQANANAGFQGAVGDVVRQGAAGIAQWVRRRTAEGNAARRDVMHTAELQAQQGVAELQANHQPVAAGIAGILADTKLAVQALKTDDPEYTRHRDALRGLGVARLRSFQNSLADASQAVEVAPGTIAPGAGQGRVGAGGERDTGKQIADAVKQALGMGGNATGAASGNFIQKLERVADGLERFLGIVTGG